jgi:hypothetical protein
MKTLMRALLILTGVYPVFAQISLEDIPTLVRLSKASAIPIVCTGYSSSPDSIKYGTGVVIGDGKSLCVVTCEHVVAIKDTNDRTIGYSPRVFGNFNHRDGQAVSILLTRVYADEQNDFAVLGPTADSSTMLRFGNVHVTMITPSQCMVKDSLVEGQPVLYVGYPLLLGMGKKNYPLSRLGAVAQLVKGDPFFLIDGFVENGHSGSPVFAIRTSPSDDTKVERVLIGIARAYPKEFSDIVRAEYKKEPSRKAVTNPGFSVVTPMDEILRVVKRLFGYH